MNSYFVQLPPEQVIKNIQQAASGKCYSYIDGNKVFLSTMTSIGGCDSVTMSPKTWSPSGETIEITVLPVASGALVLVPTLEKQFPFPYYLAIFLVTISVVLWLYFRFNGISTSWNPMQWIVLIAFFFLTPLLLEKIRSVSRPS